MQAQRIDILRDSLDDETEEHSDAVKSLAEERQVVDESGKLVQVIFDPILKCYYEPSSNLYYQVKDVERSWHCISIELYSESNNMSYQSNKSDSYSEPASNSVRR